MEYIRQSLESANEADVASLLDELDMEEALFVLRTLEHEFSADILIELDEDPKNRVIKAMENKNLAPLVDLMPSDVLVDALNKLETHNREEATVKLQAKEKAKHVPN